MMNEKEMFHVKSYHVINVHGCFHGLFSFYMKNVKYIISKLRELGYTVHDYPEHVAIGIPFSITN